jgi:hypothetical protein
LQIRRLNTRSLESVELIHQVCIYREADDIGVLSNPQNLEYRSHDYSDP